MPTSINVFVVDDDASARNGLVRLLRAAGYEVQSFASAEGFFQALSSHHMCAGVLEGCLIVDGRMPGLSSTDLASELRRHGYRLPIIVLTTDDSFAARQKALSMKAVGFFRKPVDGTALLDAVDWAHQSYYKGDQAWHNNQS